MKSKYRAIAAGAAGAVGLAARSAAAQVGESPERYRAFNYGHDMMWSSGHWGGFGMILGPILMILIVVGIVAGTVYLVRQPGAAGLSASHSAQDRALALLKERYAKGEIDSEEFAERRKLLSD